MIQRAGRRARSVQGVRGKIEAVEPQPTPVSVITQAEDFAAEPAETTSAVVSRSDMQLYQHAVKKGWVIPDEAFASLGTTMMEIVRGGNNREKVAAARVLHALHGQNLADRPTPRVHAHAHVHRVEESPNAAPQTNTATTTSAPAAADPTAHRRAALAARIARLR